MHAIFAYLTHPPHLSRNASPAKSVYSRGVPASLLWGLAGIPMGAYAITKRLNTPLVLQPQLFGVLCLTSFAQCIYYGPRRAPTDAAHPMNLPPAVRRRRQFPCAAAYAAVLAVAGGAEVGLVFTIRPAWERGHQGPVVAVGALSSVLLAIALLPQYVEIYRVRRVRGISLPFMAVDAAGGVFNDLSFVFAEAGPFNASVAVTYSIIVVMDAAVLLAAAVLNPCAARRDRERARGAGEDDTATAA